MKLKLFQDMARKSAGSTINDMLLLCISVAFGSYFDHLGIQRSDVGGVRLLLPIANPIPPSMYNDEEYGLRNGMTPVIVPLKLPSEEYTPMEALKDIKEYMTKVKKSNTPLLMSCVNRLLQPLIPVEKIAEKGIETFQRVSCVWSNVAGPFEASESRNLLYHLFLVLDVTHIICDFPCVLWHSIFLLSNIRKCIRFEEDADCDASSCFNFTSNLLRRKLVLQCYS